MRMSTPKLFEPRKGMETLGMALFELQPLGQVAIEPLSAVLPAEDISDDQSVQRCLSNFRHSCSNYKYYYSVSKS